jgi:hypothetical protein
MKREVSLPAALVFGISALVGGVSIGVAIVDHVRASKRGERMPPATGLKGPVDYAILAGAIFASAISVPAALEEWQETLSEVIP